MKFKSEFFENADELVQAKDDAETLNSEKKKRLNVVRKFSNGLATMTEEEAKNLGRKEIVNHLTTYSKLLQYESMIQSMATGTKTLAKIVVRTGDPEKDFVTGQTISNAINKGAINRKGRFAALWRKVAGEITISGGVPVVNAPRYGWLPEVSLDLIFPAGTELDAEKVTYAFEPKEYTYGDLKKILVATEGRDDSTIYDIKNIRALIATLKRQIKDRSKTNSGFSEDQVTKTVRDGSNRSHEKIDAWVYYEVKFRENGSQYVSKTVFVDHMQTSNLDDPEKPVNQRGDDATSSARIILHHEEAYEDAFTWLHMVMVDAEISGVKTVDSLRGVAELMFPSAAEMEDLINLLLEGDKIRAKPKSQLSNTAKKDDILKWNPEQDAFVPEGISDYKYESNAQHLQTPISMLDRTSSSLTGAPVANTPQGGELRVQQQERQQSNGGVQLNRLSEAYNHLDSILETVVWRLLGGDTKAGTDGYLETMWVRKTLKDAGIDFKKLSERENGQFKWIEVAAERVIGSGDPAKQSEIADWMMQSLANVEPASRPIIFQRAFAIKTGDLDLAQMAVRVPEVILNQQRLIAENETDTIYAMAASGIAVSPQPDDIHHNHIPTHLLRAQAKLAQNELRPWDLLDAVQFSGLMTHIGEHIQIVIANPVSNKEGNQFMPAYQTLIEEAKPALQGVQERQQSEANQLTPKEQADIEIQAAKLEQAAVALGMKQAEYSNLERMRAEKQALAKRSQYVKEIEAAERLQLEHKKLAEKPKPAKAAKK